jgi:hypothetical protein
MLVQTEVERVKFVVRSYIRTRLYKVRMRVPTPTPSPFRNDKGTPVPLFLVDVD